METIQYKDIDLGDWVGTLRFLIATYTTYDVTCTQ